MTGGHRGPDFDNIDRHVTRQLTEAARTLASRVSLRPGLEAILRAASRSSQDGDRVDVIPSE